MNGFQPEVSFYDPGIDEKECRNQNTDPDEDSEQGIYIFRIGRKEDEQFKDIEDGK